MDRGYVRVTIGCAVVAAALFAVSAPLLAATTTTTGLAATTTTTAPAQPALSVTPSTGLTDLETVTVVASGFLPHRDIAVSQCNLFHGSVSGVCYGPTHKEVESDASGAIRVSFVVRRVIVETGSSVDCASAPAQCGVAAGRVKTVVAPLTFDASRPPNPPSITVAPSTGLHDGDTVEVAGTGFTPDGKVILAQCDGKTLGLELCADGGRVTTVADDQGKFPTTGLVLHPSFSSVGIPGPVDCAPAASDISPCVVVAANAIGPSEFATASVGFASPAPVGPIELPHTGRASGPPVIAALISVGAGALLVLGVRRRRAI